MTPDEVTKFLSTLRRTFRDLEVDIVGYCRCWMMY
jgi:hypothetical protein